MQDGIDRGSVEVLVLGQNSIKKPCHVTEPERKRPVMARC